MQFSNLLFLLFCSVAGSAESAEIKVTKVNLAEQYTNQLLFTGNANFSLSHSSNGGGEIHGFDRDWNLTKRNLTYFSRQDKFVPKAITAFKDGLLVAGIALSEPRQLALVALKLDGSIDEQFGKNGMALAKIPDLRLRRTSGEVSIIVQSEKKILVSFKLESIERDYFADLMVRFDASGSVDPSFGQSGYLISPVPSRELFHNGHFTKLLKDGSLLSVNSLGPKNPASEPHILIQKFTADGKIDSSFANHGKLGIFHRGDVCNALDALELANGSFYLPCLEEWSGEIFFGRISAQGKIDSSLANGSLFSGSMKLPKLTICTHGEYSCIGYSQRPRFFVDPQDRLITASFRQEGEPKNGTHIFLQLTRMKLDGLLDSAAQVKLTGVEPDWTFAGNVRLIRFLGGGEFELVGTSNVALWATKLSL